MKNLSLALLLTATLLTGCGKNEETPAAVAASAPEAPVAEEAAPVVEAAAEPAPVVEAKPVAEVEPIVQSTSAMTSSLVSEASETVKAAMPEVKEAAMAVASSVDWANLSWNDVSSIPYENKDELLKWASPQIDALKDQLTKAVKEKGLTGLASLGDSGWQGALKKTVDALDTVRTSSPETWQMATGALATAWESLQYEAKKYLE